MIEWELIEKSFETPLTPEEQQQLDAWLTADPSHTEYYRRAQQGNGQTVLDGLSAELKQERRQYFIRRIEHTQHRRQYIRSVAAAVAVAAVLGGGIWLNRINHSSELPTQNLIVDFKPKFSRAILQKENQPSIQLSSDSLTVAPAVGADRVNSSASVSYERLIVPRGGRFVLTLSDGTQVWLNSDSELQFPNQFTGSVREVRLKGEAYFDVAHDARRKFVVRTENFALRVYGTAFNVSAYDDDLLEKVTLIRGSVGIESDHTNTMLALSEQYTCNKANGVSTVEKVDTHHVTAWLNGNFNFNKESIESLAHKLARWYDVPCVIENASAAADIRLVGEIEMYRNVSQVLEMLKLTGELDYRIEPSRIVLIPINH